MAADPSDVSIRPMRDDDMARMLRIQDECYSEIVPESAAALRAKFHASTASCFVACIAGEVVAYLIAVPVEYPFIAALHGTEVGVPGRPDCLYLHDLAVSEAGRGTRAGQALVRAALGFAGRAGWRRACLVAIQGSDSYWARFGFQPVDPLPAGIAAKLAGYGQGARLMALAL
jgi:predicted N-acetyltransferase YhbS